MLYETDSSSTTALRDVAPTPLPSSTAQHDTLPIPPCAQECARSLIPRVFIPDVCGVQSSLDCLCSRYANAAATLRDIFDFCISRYCGQGHPPPEHTAAGVCSMIASASIAQSPSLGHGDTASPSQSSFESGVHITSVPKQTFSTAHPLDPSTATASTAELTTSATALSWLRGAATSTSSHIKISSINAAAPSATSPLITHESSSSSTPIADPGSIAGISIGTLGAAVLVIVLCGSLISCIRSRRAKVSEEDIGPVIPSRWYGTGSADFPKELDGTQVGLHRPSRSKNNWYYNLGQRCPRAKLCVRTQSSLAQDCHAAILDARTGVVRLWSTPGHPISASARLGLPNFGPDSKRPYNSSQDGSKVDPETSIYPGNSLSNKAPPPPSQPRPQELDTHRPPAELDATRVLARKAHELDATPPLSSEPCFAGSGSVPRYNVVPNTALQIGRCYTNEATGSASHRSIQRSYLDAAHINAPGQSRSRTGTCTAYSTHISSQSLMAPLHGEPVVRAAAESRIHHRNTSQTSSHTSFDTNLSDSNGPLSAEYLQSLGIPLDVSRDSHSSISGVRYPRVPQSTTSLVSADSLDENSSRTLRRPLASHRSIVEKRRGQNAALGLQSRFIVPQHTNDQHKADLDTSSRKEMVMISPLWEPKLTPKRRGGELVIEVS